mmetsp:Transcript_1012/g.1825  ORF Transcript_1012/g.1825 Transcript_1012/m.1825 type:complete len:444 (+) Transcript_1012:160-1491(+)
MEHHGHVLRDSYNAIRYDKEWQKRIIRQEDKTLEKWLVLTQKSFLNWRSYTFQRQDPGVREQIPEKFGDFVYFLQEGRFEKSAVKGGRKVQGQGGSQDHYPIYCRHPFNLVGQKLSLEEQDSYIEVVLDMAEVPWLPKRKMRTTVVDKIKVNSDHSLIAYTLDIGNTEKCSVGIKEMRGSGTYWKDMLVENVSQVEFFGGRHGHEVVYYVELNEHNRPYKVVRQSLKTMKRSVLLVDEDPTHYLDIAVSKDKQFLFINSGTKEDAEVWYIKSQAGGSRSSEDQDPASFTPQLLVKRQSDVRVHVDHVRDFFIMISNRSSFSKNMGVYTLKDEALEQPLEERKQLWQDLLELEGEIKGELKGGDSDQLVINEFDCFEKFIAVYVTIGSRPSVLIQDLDSKQFKKITVNNNDIGRIDPMLNQEYGQRHLRFMFDNPFVYQQMYEY